MNRLFISYARPDADAAERMAAALEERGLQVWWDRRLQGGSEYSRDIERALDEAQAVLVLWSVESARSAWVRDEAAAARDQDKLIPVALDGSAPPMGFRQYHAIDLRDWLRSADRALPRELLDSIAARLNGSPEPDRPRPPPPEAKQEIRFCKAMDGTTLAYSLIGSGPPLVKAANWLNHLEFDLKLPVWQDWIALLSEGHRLLRYDERGNGMSDWSVEDLSLDAFVQDLETVVDASGFGRFDLVGISQGAPVAVAFATRHPERVRRLVLVGGFAVGWAIWRAPEAIETWETMVRLAGLGWGKDNPAFRQVFTSQCFPDSTPATARLFNELQRVSASAEGAQRLMRAIGQIDVRPMLGRVTAPTLVMHCRRDSFVPFEAGRGMASRIPGARFVALESGNHIPDVTDSAWLKLSRHLRAFLDED